MLHHCQALLPLLPQVLLVTPTAGRSHRIAELVSGLGCPATRCGGTSSCGSYLPGAVPVDVAGLAATVPAALATLVPFDPPPHPPWDTGSGRHCGSRRRVAVVVGGSLVPYSSVGPAAVWAALDWACAGCGRYEARADVVLECGEEAAWVAALDGPWPQLMGSLIPRAASLASASLHSSPTGRQVASSGPDAADQTNGPTNCTSRPAANAGILTTSAIAAVVKHTWLWRQLSADPCLASLYHPSWLAAAGRQATAIKVPAASPDGLPMDLLAFTKDLMLRANLGYDPAGILVEADTESVLKARSNPQVCSGDNDTDEYSGLLSEGIANSHMVCSLPTTFVAETSYVYNSEGLDVALQNP